MIYGSNNIFNTIEKCLKNIGIDEQVELRYSNLDGVDIQCNTLLRIAKLNNLAELKESLLKNLLDLKEVESVTVNDKNFINIKLSDYYFQKYTKFDYMSFLSKNPESILIDYGGPNIGKDLHVGHIRTLNLGRSIYNINKLAGNRIVSDIHFGDWGMPIGLIIAYCDYNNLDLNKISYKDLEAIYPLANKLSSEDKEFYNIAKTISKELNFKNPKYIELDRRRINYIFEKSGL